MTGNMSIFRSRHLLGLSSAAVLVGAVVACSGSPTTSGATNVRCANYAVHAGVYRDEVQVLVAITNSATEPARYAIEVDMTRQNTGAGAVSAVRTTITGLVAAKTSTQLGRKVLTTGPVSRCRIGHVGRS